MRLHVFNPEHDIALASNLANFTAPHAGRQLRADLGFLPALWAAEGDAILVDHAEQAMKAWKRLAVRHSLGWNKSFTWIEKGSPVGSVTAVDVWGWDRALKSVLLRRGVSERVLPSDDRLEDIRQLSHRRTAARLLPLLQGEGTVGEAFECTSPEEAGELLARYGRVVMKAPWSSSGRGLRFLSADRTPFCTQAGWFRNLVASQGSVMVEPYYDKVKDFGMEFEATDEGIHYLGLSLFHTVNGAYVGNILATEKRKREYISRYISTELLDAIQEKISNLLDLGSYRGPFGIDMMVVGGEQGFRLHPCVEINLRRTMGHVALVLSPSDDDIRKVMRIVYDGCRYRLRILKNSHT